MCQFLLILNQFSQSYNKTFQRSGFLKHSVCECHKSSSRSSDVTVGVTPPAPGCQIRRLSMLGQRKCGAPKTPKMRFSEKMTPSGKIRNSVLKVFMTSPIHVLCSNFTEIVNWEVGETIRCFADKNVCEMRFLRHFVPVWRRMPKICRGACHVTLRFPVKFRPNMSDLPELFPKQLFRTNTHSSSNCIHCISHLTSATQ